MENAFQSKLEEISGKMGELVSEEHKTSLLEPAIPFQHVFFKEINDRSKKLKEYDDRVTRAMEERDLRYKDRKAWNDVVPSPRTFRFGPKQKGPLAQTESMLIAAYDHAG